MLLKLYWVDSGVSIAELLFWCLIKCSKLSNCCGTRKHYFESFKFTFDVSIIIIIIIIYYSNVYEDEVHKKNKKIER